MIFIVKITLTKYKSYIYITIISGGTFVKAMILAKSKTEYFNGWTQSFFTKLYDKIASRNEQTTFVKRYS